MIRVGKQNGEWIPSLERAGLLVFFFGMWTTRFVAIAGFFLLIFGACRNFSVTRERVWGSLPCKLALAWTIYISLSALVFAAIYPDHWYVMLNQGLRLIYLAGFILIALGFYRHNDLVWPCIALSFLGFFLARLLHILWLLLAGMDITEIRPELGLHTSIAMGQYAFFTMMALIIFFSQIVGQRWRLARVLVWIVLFAFTCFLILISRSRSTWILVPLLLPALVFSIALIKKISMRQLTFLIVAITLTLLLSLQWYSEQIVERLTTEWATLERVFAGDLKSVSASTEEGRINPIGVRVLMIQYGIEHWWQNPVFGLGPGATKMLLQCCTPEVFKQFNDLHSFVPEMLLRTGLVGFTIFFLLNAVLIKVAISAYRSSVLPGEILLLIVFGLSLHWAVALVNFRMVNYDWRFYWFMLAGIAAAHSFRDPDRSE